MIFASPEWVTQGKKSIHLRMFIRKKKNRSGTTSVVVAEKRKGVFRELRTIGVSEDKDEIKDSFLKAKNGFPFMMVGDVVVRKGGVVNNSTLCAV